VASQKQQKPYEGCFITLEGGDGCGKTTLSFALAKELEKKGYSVLRTREPGGTPLSEHLRDLLLQPDTFAICGRAEMMLFLTARVQHLEEVILPALRSGKIVLCERFNDSTIAYQACARHLGTEQVTKICDLVCDGIAPDLTLLLDVPAHIAIERVKDGKDRLEQEHLRFHEEVRHGYLRLADTHPERIVVLDATTSEQEVFCQAWAIVEPRLALKPHVC